MQKIIYPAKVPEGEKGEKFGLTEEFEENGII